MTFDPSTRLISSIYDTVLALDSWPQALQRMAAVLDAVGAAYIISNRRTGAVIAGTKLPYIAVNFGVRITTLRTQLSSILRKVGAERQADLIRILSGLPNISVESAESE